MDNEDQSDISPPPQGGYISEKELAENIHREVLESTPSGRLLLQKEALRRKATEPITLEKVKTILSKTIKADDNNKLILFLCFLLNYSEEDQQNIAFNAPSSTGKSYIALEVSKFFPPEDVKIHSYTSPTAFFHALGKLSTPDGQPLKDLHEYVEEGLQEWEEQNPKPTQGVEKWREQRKSEIRRLRNLWESIDKIYVVSLERLILIFVDQPHDRLLQVVRALLSHDQKRLPVKITDKTKEGGNRTKSILIVGFPTWVFNSTSFSLNEQEKTRFWLLSPEINQSKLRDSLTLQAEALGDRQTFKASLEADEERELLRELVRAIKELSLKEVIIRPEDRSTLCSDFLRQHPELSPRHQRDFPRLIALVKAIALLNAFYRQRSPDGSGIYAEKEDIIEAKKLLEGIIEANELGIPPYAWDFYIKSLKPMLSEHGLTREEVSKLYFSHFKTRIGEKARKRLLELYSEAGVIYEGPDPEDRRIMRIYPPQEGGE